MKREYSGNLVSVPPLRRNRDENRDQKAYTSAQRTRLLPANLHLACFAREFHFISLSPLPCVSLYLVGES